MNYRLRLGVVLCAFFPFYAYGGGNPDFVEFPEDYAQSFDRYATINRGNQKQVGKLYANETAVSSYAEDGTAGPGSIIVMEVYKPKVDDEGKPVVGSDGIFKIDSLAAVAVMEKRDSWDTDYPEDEQAGNWGFALYSPDGSPMSNDLACAQCHIPLDSQDYLFTQKALIDHAKH